MAGLQRCLFVAQVRGAVDRCPQNTFGFVALCCPATATRSHWLSSVRPSTATATSLPVTLPPRSRDPLLLHFFPPSDLPRCARPTVSLFVGLPAHSLSLLFASPFTRALCISSLGPFNQHDSYNGRWLISHCWGLPTATTTTPTPSHLYWNTDGSGLFAFHGRVCLC